MKANFETRNRENQREFTFYIPGHWVAFIAQVIAEGITNVVAATITVVVTILVIIGGLWLAYVYLPANIFYIILAVLIADIVLGLVLRAVFFRR